MDPLSLYPLLPRRTEGSRCTWAASIQGNKVDYLFSLNLGPGLMLYESSDCLSNDVLILVGVIVADLAVGFQHVSRTMHV